MHDSTIRKRRLRQRRKEQGWEAYELWLPPDTVGLLAALKQPGEALHEMIGRALRALQAQDTPGPPPTMGEGLHPAQYRDAMVKRLRAMKAEGLSLQKMADRLNSEGVPTVSGHGRWQKGTISDMLAQG